MKYIRTKDNYGGEEMIFDTAELIKTKSELMPYNTDDGEGIMAEDIIKQADTIEELCDEFVGISKINHKAYTGKLDGAYWFKQSNGWLDRVDNYEKIYGAIYTDKGLIYKAELKGVLPNGEIDWELL